MGTYEEPLRQRFCRGIDCGRVFWICRHCYRGHKYCSLRCRQKTRGQQIRTAKRKHQKSQEGRDDHRDRNRAYRARRRRQRVTYHTSPAPSDSDSIDPTEPSPSENGPGSVSGEARYAVRPEFEPACIICGRTRRDFPSPHVGPDPPKRRKPYGLEVEARVDAQARRAQRRVLVRRPVAIAHPFSSLCPPPRPAGDSAPNRRRGGAIRSSSWISREFAQTSRLYPIKGRYCHILSPRITRGNYVRTSGGSRAVRFRSRPGRQGVGRPK